MLRESLRILSWLIQSHYAIQKLNATGPSAWCKSAKILHEHKILIFITYHTIQKLHECWPGPQRSKVLTDIYPKFAKLFIQRAGPKRIQHNAPWAKIMHEPKSYCLILFSQKMFKYAIQNLHKPCSSNGALVLWVGPCSTAWCKRTETWSNKKDSLSRYHCQHINEDVFIVMRKCWECNS